MRYALGLEYNGSKFHGWQIQKDVRSAQQCVEESLSKVADHSVKIICAGRTDKGVHATNQIIHFDTSAERALFAWIGGTNAHLPDGATVKWATPVSEKFHARFSAQRRGYRYIIYNHAIRSALLDPLVGHYHDTLDVSSMMLGAEHLIGTHDFTAFKSSNCQSKQPVRTIYSIFITQNGAFIYVDILADGFLQNMVRIMLGCLCFIGCGRKESSWAKEVLQSKARSMNAPTMPPNGLYLTTVCYDSKYNLPYTTIIPTLHLDTKYAD